MIFLPVAQPDRVSEWQFFPSTSSLSIPVIAGRREMAKSLLDSSGFSSCQSKPRTFLNTSIKVSFSRCLEEKQHLPVWQEAFASLRDVGTLIFSSSVITQHLTIREDIFYFLTQPLQRPSRPGGNPYALCVNDLIVNYFSTGKPARPSQSTQVHSSALGLIFDGMEQHCNDEVVKSWGLKHELGV